MSGAGRKGGLQAVCDGQAARPRAHSSTQCAMTDLLELVLDSGELRNEFGRQIMLADVLRIVRGEVVALHAEGARPELGAVVHLWDSSNKGA